MPSSGLLGWRDWKFPETMFYASTNNDVQKETGAFQSDGYNSNMPRSLFASQANNPVRHPELSIGRHLYWRSVQPMFKNFLTDMTSSLMTGQGQQCQDFEVNAMECIEYYGAHQGMEACKDWYEDYIECQSGAKQLLRQKAMFRKRHYENHLEYIQGKRTWDETYEPPPKSHGYKEPWMNEYFGKSIA